MNYLFIIFFVICSMSVIAQTQQSIDEALNESFRTQSDEPLKENLKTLEDDTYWQAYNFFQQAIFQMHGKKKPKVSAELVDTAKQLLQSTQDKTSDDYALLAMVHSFSMQFLSDPQALQAAEEQFYQWIDIAIKMDAKNPQVYYVKGMYEWHKPAEYGGSKQKAKRMLEKAIALYEGELDNEKTWGRDYAKQLLETN